MPWNGARVGWVNGRVWAGTTMAASGSRSGLKPRSGPAFETRDAGQHLR